MILNRSYPSLIAAEENITLSMSANDTIKKDMWIGDTGASVHMCNSLDGLVETRNGVGNIKVGSGKLLKIEKVGKFIGEVMQKNGKTQTVTLTDVNYVQGLFCNLFSITSTLEKGFILSGGGRNPVTLTKGNVVVEFDRDIKSGGGKLIGVMMKPLRESKCLVSEKVTCVEAHNRLAHASEAITKATAKKLKWIISGKMNFCDSCAKGKARVKNIKKETDTPVKKKGDVLALDISSVKYVSKGNKKFWLRLMDLHTKMKWSYFLKNKSETADIVVNF